MTRDLPEARPHGPAPDQPAARSSHLVDLTPLRESPAFARLWFGNTLAGIGTFVTTTAVGLHIYDLTHSTFMVSLVAWFSLGPMIVAGLYGGAIADRFDARFGDAVQRLGALRRTLLDRGARDRWHEAVGTLVGDDFVASVESGAFDERVRGWA